MNFKIINHSIIDFDQVLAVKIFKEIKLKGIGRSAEIYYIRFVFKNTNYFSSESFDLCYFNENLCLEDFKKIKEILKNIEEESKNA